MPRKSEKPLKQDPLAYVAQTNTAELRYPDRKGGERLDPTPIQPPLGYKRTPSLHEQIAHQVQRAKLDAHLDTLQETEEEADDFNIGDDYEPLSKYENEHIPPLRVLKARAEKIRQQTKQRLRADAIKAHEKSLKKPAIVSPANLPDPPVKQSSEENEDQ